MIEATRRRTRMAIGAALALLTLIGAGVAARYGTSPPRCPDGAVALGPRCCGPGQHLEEGRCAGAPTACPSSLLVTPEGCVAAPRRVQIAGGALPGFAPDWEAAGRNDLPKGSVGAVDIDAFEVTEARWAECVERAGCSPSLLRGEPGAPVRGVSLTEARAFCSFAGGRLPTPEEHAFAGAGAEGRRYPWGFAGVVCRRVAFGLTTGPCAEGATGPELAGMRPDGATPSGIHDLAGNVAEWTERGGAAVIRGGSYTSTGSVALRTWSGEPADGTERSDSVGFRCAYP